MGRNFGKKKQKKGGKKNNAGKAKVNVNTKNDAVEEVTCREVAIYQPPASQNESDSDEDESVEWASFFSEQRRSHNYSSSSRNTYRQARRSGNRSRAYDDEYYTEQLLRSFILGHAVRAFIDHLFECIVERHF
ncbi:uncharacterized protein LOC106641303 [Copidosoma floridanum]|uniref:uncharacterized protein LOC106641303 n=1 Tax=Copidosoma floridanum TaxID=29053 RepID=UPI0006C96C4B|nr:uncharacterized protein LOC106641303 [Copidosoma floridanum]